MADTKTVAPKESVGTRLWNWLTETQIWTSIFRHDRPDSDRGRVLVMLSNVFLHLHPVRIRKSGVKLRYTWCMGGLSFFLFLVLTFTGLLLVGDVPLIHSADDARFALLGGTFVGEGALLRFYVLHCVGLPLVIGVLMAVHFWRVRKDGGISGPL